MNVIDLLGLKHQNNSAQTKEKITNAYSTISSTFTSELVLINDEYMQNLKKEFEKTNELINKAIIHREFLKSLINFDNKGKMTLVRAIVFILENEKNELHRDEIYEKIKTLNLSKPYVEKGIFGSTLGYLKKVNKITHGKERGYWKSTKTEY